jgi:hypothetical protein
MADDCFTIEGTPSLSPAAMAATQNPLLLERAVSARNDSGFGEAWTPSSSTVKQLDKDQATNPVYITEMLVVGLLRAAISNRSIMGDHVEFEVTVLVGDEENAGGFLLIKRYSDFAKLLTAVSENWHVPARFPPKHSMTSMMGSWKDTTFLDGRQAQLTMWMESLVAMFQGQEVNTIPIEVIQFFTLTEM